VEATGMGFITCLSSELQCSMASTKLLLFLLETELADHCSLLEIVAASLVLTNMTGRKEVLKEENFVLLFWSDFVLLLLSF
jgi:hypothetical protein